MDEVAALPKRDFGVMVGNIDFDTAQLLPQLALEFGQLAELFGARLWVGWGGRGTRRDEGWGGCRDERADRWFFGLMLLSF